MRKIEEYLKNYLKKDLSRGRGHPAPTPQCLDEEALLDYLGHKLDGRKRKDVEEHLSQCNFCLSQLNLAFEAKKSGIGGKVPSRLINKAKALLSRGGVTPPPTRKGGPRRMRKNLFLAGAIIFFVTSFLLPKYFMQCLVAALILSMRWVFESENGRTLIMVLDSWRRHSHDEDDEISNRLKNRFKSSHL